MWLASLQVKVVEASLDTAEGELEAFQREKQQRLNELHVVVPLKLHQVMQECARAAFGLAAARRFQADGK